MKSNLFPLSQNSQFELRDDDMTSSEIVTTKARIGDVAEYFQISQQTVWRWRQESSFPRPLKRGRVVLYDIVAIEEWLAKGV